MATTFKPLDLPVTPAHRLRVRELPHDPAAGGPAVVALERKVFGPFWQELDQRVREGYSKLSPAKQAAWLDEVENELIEEWFAQEIYDLRQ